MTTIVPLDHVLIQEKATAGDVLLLAVKSRSGFMEEVFRADDGMSVRVALTVHAQIDATEARAFLRKHGYDMTLPP